VVSCEFRPEKMCWMLLLIIRKANKVNFGKRIYALKASISETIATVSLTTSCSNIIHNIFTNDFVSVATKLATKSATNLYCVLY
jgi:hypothetical protein